MRSEDVTAPLRRNYLAIALGAGLLAVLYLTGTYSYLLFHSLAEVFSVCIAFGIFVVAWHSRQSVDGGFFRVIGVAYLFVGGIDLLHALSADGMGVFAEGQSNLAAQLWVSARYLESVSLLLALFLIRRTPRPRYIIMLYAAVFATLLGAIFLWQVFPDSFIAGTGTTTFYVASEVAIIVTLLAAFALLLRTPRGFAPSVRRLLLAAIAATAGAELSSIVYTDAFGFLNLLGHFLKLISYYLVYRAIVQTGLTRPSDLIFRRRSQTEEQHRELYENAPTAYLVLDVSGRIHRANRRAPAILGHPMDALVGRSLLDLATDSPSGRERLERTFRRALDEDGPTGEDVEMRRADGSDAWLHLSVKAVRGQQRRAASVLVQMTDITQRRHAEEALEASERRNRALVESSPDGVCVLDSGGRVLDCNEEASRLLGRSPDEISGLDFRQLLGDATRDLLGPWLDDITSEGRAEMELDLVHRDGQSIQVWAKAVALHDADGQPNRAAIYMRDVGEREELGQIRDEFIGVLSHELRSPLTVIMGAVNTVLTEAEHLSREETRQLLQDAAWEIESLTHLLGNLLEVSQAQSDRLLLHVEPVDVRKVVQGTVDKLAPRTSRHRFIIDAPPDLVPAQADRLRLERILYNLLENAIKYSPRGGEITVTVRQDEAECVLAVADQGVGLSQDDQQRILRPIQRRGNFRFSETGGVGLGLQVCRRLVETHGGRISVASEVGRGSTFTFTLPLSPRQ